jgi:hypothetical protein
MFEDAPLFSICAEAAGIKRISAVTRALFMSVSVGEKQIAKGDFFGSFLCQQRNEQTSPLCVYGVMRVRGQVLQSYIYPSFFFLF